MFEAEGQMNLRSVIDFAPPCSFFSSLFFALSLSPLRSLEIPL